MKLVTTSPYSNFGLPTHTGKIELELVGDWVCDGVSDGNGPVVADGVELARVIDVVLDGETDVDDGADPHDFEAEAEWVWEIETELDGDKNIIEM